MTGGDESWRRLKDLQSRTQIGRRCRDRGYGWILRAPPGSVVDAGAAWRRRRMTPLCARSTWASGHSAFDARAPRTRAGAGYHKPCVCKRLLYRGASGSFRSTHTLTETGCAQWNPFLPRPHEEVAVGPAGTAGGDVRIGGGPEQARHGGRPLRDGRLHG